MNKTLIFRKIGGIISEITEQYQYLAESPENINPLELELFIANAHFLSEHLAILKKLENTTEYAAPASPIKNLPVQETLLEEDYPADEHVSAFIDEEPDIINEPELFFENPIDLKANEDLQFNEAKPQAEKVEDTPDHQQYQAYEGTLNNNTEYQHENIVEEQEVLPVKEDPAEEETSEVIEDLNVVPLQEKTVPVNNFQAQEVMETKPAAEEKVPTLNEILAAGKSNENMAAKISRNEDRDLKSMIKLNDKLMFVRDLFNGYSLAYSEAIDMVNRFDNFKAAENFLLQNYAAKNRWSEKQQTVDQFYEVLNKRFS